MSSIENGNVHVYMKKMGMFWFDSIGKQKELPFVRSSSLSLCLSLSAFLSLSFSLTMSPIVDLQFKQVANAI